jgi:hypothetical protein
MGVVAEHTTRWLALVALAASCKPAPQATSVRLADDLDQIEAELQRSEARLGDAGIVVAYRQPRATEAPAETPPEPPPDEPPEEPPTEPGPGPELEPVTPVPPPTASTTPTEEFDEPAAAPADLEGEPVLRSRAGRARGRDYDRRAKRSERRKAKKSAQNRCERVCELSVTTCELQERVCGLADEHPDDVRYEDACRRAEDQCEAASRSCESCAV